MLSDADFGTRSKRRIAVRTVLDYLAAIRDAENRYLENVPDNFQSTESYEAGEYAVDTLEEIMDRLAEVY
jgi:hypothetical protein